MVGRKQAQWLAMSLRVVEPPVSTSDNASASQRSGRPRVVMLVSNPCISDTRVIRAAETVSAQGFETVVLAASDQEQTTEEHRNSVIYRRLAKSGRRRRSSIGPFSDITTLELAQTFLGHAPQVTSGSMRPSGEAEVFSRLAISLELGRRLLIRTAALILRPFQPIVATQRMRKLFEGEALELRPHLVHAHDFITLPAGAAIANKLGSVLLYDAHELEVHRNTKSGPWTRRLRAALERKYIRQCDAVITVCDSIADHLAREYAIKRPFVVMNAPDVEQQAPSETDLRSSLGLSPGAPLVVYVGRITTGRGVEQSVSALQHIPGYHLALVGPTNLLIVDTARRLAEELGVADLVHIVPPVSPDTVVSFVKSADVSLIPIQNVCLSYYYCLPNKLLESAEAGLPVVVSNFPELRRFVEIGGAGIVMDETDPADIARAIREAYGNKHLLVPGPERLRRLENIYGWTKQKDTLSALYKSFDLSRC